MKMINVITPYAVLLLMLSASMTACVLRTQHDGSGHVVRKTTTTTERPVIQQRKTTTTIERR
jgi:hypothetical protein